MKALKIAIICVVCALLVGGTYFFATRPALTGEKKGGGRPQGGGGQQNVVSVKTQVANVAALQDYVNTTGEIEASSSVQVFPDIGGKITSVSVSLGSKVKKGDVIAKIDPSSPGMQYALNSVYAPIGGTITTQPLKQGTTVSTNTAVTTIGNVAELQLSANVPERYVASLKTGLKALVTLEADPDHPFDATVSRVAPIIDSTSRTKEVILTFDTEDSRINAGMFAKVKLYTDVYAGRICIPEAAIVEKSGKKYVYIVNADGQSVSQREVTTGKTVDNVVQILTGVQQGEKVVVEGMRVLGDGSQIRDITEGAATSASSGGNDGGRPQFDGQPPADGERPAGGRDGSQRPSRDGGQRQPRGNGGGQE